MPLTLTRLGVASDVADLRDYGVRADWQSTLGAVMTSGQPTLSNTVTPFISADVGKHVIVNTGGSPSLFHSTILSVNGSGVATLAHNAPASSGNQRVRWGSDSGPAITAALAALAADASVKREAYLPPGLYRATQVVVPQRIKLRGAGWGNYGPTIGSTSGWTQTAASNSLIWQLPGAQADLLTFTGGSSDAFGHVFVGPVEVSDIILAGPEQDVNATSFTTGSGLAFKNDGATATTQDGCLFERIHASGFPQDGFSFPGGGVPLTVRHCRAFYNGRYGLNLINADGYSFQAIHVLDFSGDGNSDGLCRFKSGNEWGSLALTNIKSEAGDYFPVAGDTCQERAVIFEDCDDTPVVINGLTHISSCPSGAATIAPGPAITIRGTGVPKITFNAIGVRVAHPGTDTGVADAVTLRDEINDVDVARTTVSGVYPS